ncbi:hypothetical protein [Phenylobacterium sp.]|uniref:hypothetical protein n=1 Tax=Phenylobacterium sp. TaxID=1871053 RepID=UPI0025ED3D42|nr:hypothetical protein [Phenylobacterium sp.]
MLVAPAPAAAQPADLYFERTMMSAADGRCRLFTPELSAALAAGAAQARGAALRAGVEPKDLAALERRAQAQAARLDCHGRDLAQAAARVQDAFAGFQRVTRMTWPGDVADWRADRGVGRATRWRVAQDVIFGPDHMTFGLAGREGASGLVAVAAFADGQTPYAARLVLRDEARTLGPYLGLAADAPLSRKLPPRSATRGFLAEARTPADAELLPKGAEDGWAFRFPAAAAQALADLDPREGVAVEFLFPGDKVRTAYVEVGDFAAARAFLQIAAR